MNKNVYTNKGNVALEEYVLKGNRISILEGVLYFGVSNPYEAIRRLKKKGFVIKKNTSHYGQNFSQNKQATKM